MKVGFIGTGNMASAIIKGMIAKGFMEPSDIYVSSLQLPKLKKFAEETGTTFCPSNEELVAQVDVVILAVKPNLFEKILPGLQPNLQDRKPLIVSIAAGVSLEKIQRLIGDDYTNPIVRVMPNVNAMIGESMSAVSKNEHVTTAQMDFVLGMFNAVGLAIEIEERYFSIFIGIAGSAPAYAYLFIDSLARGALKAGMNKEQATRIAAQTVLGSAKMILESNEAPWVLIDKVCSPGGTTIAGISALEDRNFISTVMHAVEATIQRDKEISADQS